VKPYRPVIVSSRDGGFVEVGTLLRFHGVEAEVCRHDPAPEELHRIFDDDADDENYSPPSTTFKDCHQRKIPLAITCNGCEVTDNHTSNVSVLAPVAGPFTVNVTAKSKTETYQYVAVEADQIQWDKPCPAVYPDHDVLLPTIGRVSFGDHGIELARRNTVHVCLSREGTRIRCWDNDAWEVYGVLKELTAGPYTLRATYRELAVQCDFNYAPQERSAR
jgi:hypothetical protein